MAVNVTGWPYADGLVSETNVVVLPLRLTVCKTAFEVLV